MTRDSDADISQHQISHYRARSASWSIRTDNIVVQDFVNRLFTDLAAAESNGTTGFDFTGSQLPTPDDFDRVVGFINQAIVTKASNTVDLHASAATDPVSGLTVFTTAPSGGGKTTIAAELCRRGWSYLSDETVGIDTDNGSLIGCGKPLTVKRGLASALDVDLGPLTIDAARQQRWYVRPALLGGCISADAPPPTDLVFIDFDADASATTIESVPVHAALLRLLSNTYRLERHGADVLRTLAHLVASTRIWEIRTSDSARAVDLLLEAAADTALPEHKVHYRPPTDLSHSDPAQGPVRGPAPAPRTASVGFQAVGAVIFDAQRSQAALLDPIGMLTWQLLDGTAPVSEIARELAVHFQVPITTIDDDVRALTTQLIASEFLIGPNDNPLGSA